MQKLKPFGKKSKVQLVVNLRNKTFTKDTFKILNKNLNFLPTFKTNKQNLCIEMESFFRLVKLKTHFKDQYNEKLNAEDQSFKPQSNKKWKPNKNRQIIETYIAAAERELKQQRDISDNKGQKNLSKSERIALKELSDLTDIIITKADKGGTVVIMDANDYINEAHHQLNIKDPTTNIAKLVNTIQNFKKEKLLKEKIADGSKLSNPKTPKFYMQPKVHKNDNLARQVVSSVSCHTSSIFKYIDNHLSPIVKDISSYVRDTKDFLTKLSYIRHIHIFFI